VVIRAGVSIPTSRSRDSRSAPALGVLLALMRTAAPGWRSILPGEAGSLRSSIALLLGDCIPQTPCSSASARAEDGTTLRPSHAQVTASRAMLNIETPGPRALGDSVIR